MGFLFRLIIALLMFLWIIGWAGYLVSEAPDLLETTEIDAN